MAEDDVVLASAVVVPDPAQDSPPAISPPINGSLKRRRSSVTSNDSKRPRLSNGPPPDRRNSATSPPANGARARPIRKPSGQEERQRGKRLFGALLGALGQNKTTAAQKKRVEIEQKQQEKIRQQTEEDEAERRERLDKLDRRRRREQWVWEEQSLKARHSIMRAQAKMLKTRAEPCLYYLPYETSKEEEGRIKRQRDDVEDDIDHELDGFEERRRPALEQLDREEGVASRSPVLGTVATNGNAETAVQEQGHAPMETDQLAGNTAGEHDTAMATTNGTHGSPNGEPESHGDQTADEDAHHAPSADLEQPKDAEQTAEEAHRDQHDDAGEVVEGDEDTVIY